MGLALLKVQSAHNVPNFAKKVPSVEKGFCKLDGRCLVPNLFCQLVGWYGKTPAEAAGIKLNINNGVGRLDRASD
jgi:hypothetical protein